ncbi:hypothetical protein [Mitsuaria sp. GD03876]|uniref:hypothetical protein n=1 Tax=Mitsuaria sp. GD03876 TaxID=2975399 RepID=UPI00244A7402|nr:hypothetical protein [Mitsuaria sp. GD03876]MDH0866476.1 hypothetical protein [Mitsuaria sp. GD03876]
MTEKSLEDWMASNPPAKRGPLAPHRKAMQQLSDAGYTHEEIRTWLAAQGVQVSRQAVTKALASEPASTPASNRPQRGESPLSHMQGEATGTQPWKTSTNPSAAPRPGPDATLKDRAQAVGDQYLNKIHNPLVTRLLSSKTNRKT